MEHKHLPPVAQKFYAPCKKCECERYHVVLSHSDSQTARLECEVCKSKSSFKLVESRRPKIPGTGKKVNVRAKASKSSRYKELRESSNVTPQPYNMKSEFAVGSALEHPKFGLGFVIMASGQSIQVVFEDEERSLVHKRV